jgi:REP element-mobilizing transposase RayT
MDCTHHPGHRALRVGRTSLPGQVYLVTTVVRAREPLFAQPALAWAACRALHASLARPELDSLCWVLMPDHLHLLHRLVEGDLSRRVGYLKARMAAAANQQRGGTNPLWCRGFHDHAMRTDEDLAKAAAYVIANPVRAGLADSPMMYPWWNCSWSQTPGAPPLS